jgi:hypothetical protein
MKIGLLQWKTSKKTERYSKTQASKTDQYSEKTDQYKEIFITFDSQKL